MTHSETQSSASTSTSNSAELGGDGYDGKLYVRLGVCAEHADQIVDSIRVTSVVAESYFERKDCVDVAPRTVFVDASQLVLSSDTVQYGTQTFNSVSTALDRLKVQGKTIGVTFTSAANPTPYSSYGLKYSVGPNQNEIYTAMNPAGDDTRMFLALPANQILLYSYVFDVGSDGQFYYNGTLMGTLQETPPAF